MAEGGDLDVDLDIVAVVEAAVAAAVADLAGQQWFHQQTGPQCGMCDGSGGEARSMLVGDGWDSAAG